MKDEVIASNANDTKKNIAIFSNYTPTRCGIATFAQNVYDSIVGCSSKPSTYVVAVDNPEERIECYPPEVRYIVSKDKVKDYQDAADFLKIKNCEAVVVQHEFGIYGGSEGSYLLDFLRQIDCPIIVMLHTILTSPTLQQRKILEEIISLSHKIVVMSNKGASILDEHYKCPTNKVKIIPHGIPNPPIRELPCFKKRYNLEDKNLLLTFGLLGPSKGIENVIDAMPQINAYTDNVVYVILGATHPALVRQYGEQYRQQLKERAAKLNVLNNIIFIDKFLEPEELASALTATDVYITPYSAEAQITSGTLSYAYGLGNAVVSTPYWHASELLANGKGRLVPFNSPIAIADAVSELLNSPLELDKIQKSAAAEGEHMYWSVIGNEYYNLIESLEKDEGSKAKLYLTQPLFKRYQSLPMISLEHFKSLTDDLGILQHSIYGLNRYSEGYCLDDNIRALLLCLNIHCDPNEPLEFEAEIKKFAAFVQYAFDEKSGKMRNFLTSSRQWADSPHLDDDSSARTVWVLGVLIEKYNDSSLRRWATELFFKLASQAEQSEHIRPWAFALLGLTGYLRKLPNDREAQTLAIKISTKLLEKFQKNSDDDWIWFENYLSYDNAKVSQSLIEAGTQLSVRGLLEAGLESLEWLSQKQTNVSQQFRAIGTRSVCTKDVEPAIFDQQPIEAWASISAYHEAFHATQDEKWLVKALDIYDWFLGRNDSALPLVTKDYSGCFDGLKATRPNLNTGAESTLAFLNSLYELRTLGRQVTRTVGNAATLKG